MDLTLRALTRWQEVPAAPWDELDHGESPFLRAGFLQALEESGSVGARSGWRPLYLLVEGGGELLGAIAAFHKDHSYGEYIFDWAWARASERAGIGYYPKITIAAPHTPATGKRILLRRTLDTTLRERVTSLLLSGLRGLAQAQGASSIHWLFVTADEQHELSSRGFLARASFQFHWHNDGYESFEAFLAALNSRKRKQIRKERARAREQVDAIVWRRGSELDKDELATLDRHYRRTCSAHGGQAYLRPGFFEKLARTMPEPIRWLVARRDDRDVASALFFQTHAALYGRYWGCDEHIEMLHFELAYYQGIELAINAKLPLFEAGAQGEHKLLRGFLPQPTYSSHWLAEPRIHAAVEQFLTHESEAVAEHMEMLAMHGPFRHSEPIPPATSQSDKVRGGDARLESGDSAGAAGQDAENAPRIAAQTIRAVAEEDEQREASERDEAPLGPETERDR